MARTIGIGVIGLGWMGTAHSRSYLQIPHRFQDSEIQPRLVVCADEVEFRARRAESLYRFERYTTDWQKVVADADVDVVISPPPTYAFGNCACGSRRGQAYFL